MPWHWTDEKTTAQNYYLLCHLITLYNKSITLKKADMYHSIYYTRSIHFIKESPVTMKALPQRQSFLSSKASPFQIIQCYFCSKHVQIPSICCPSFTACFNIMRNSSCLIDSAWQMLNDRHMQHWWRPAMVCFVAHLYQPNRNIMHHLTPNHHETCVQSISTVVFGVTTIFPNTLGIARHIHQRHRYNKVQGTRYRSYWQGKSKYEWYSANYACYVPWTVVCNRPELWWSPASNSSIRSWRSCDQCDVVLWPKLGSLLKPAS